MGTRERCATPPVYRIRSERAPGWRPRPERARLGVSSMDTDPPRTWLSSASRKPGAALVVPGNLREREPSVKPPCPPRLRGEYAGSGHRATSALRPRAIALLGVLAIAAIARPGLSEPPPKPDATAASSA